jgi:hypothetical protein
MWRLLLGTALLLAACGSKCASNEANVTGNQAPVSATNAPSAGNFASNESDRDQENASNRTQASNSLGTLPPPDAALRFVGTWATNPGNCSSKPWRFTAHELTARDGPHCSIYKVSKVAGGYDLAAQCPAKKPVPTDLIRVRFAESARAMLVESNAISPMGLVYCGQ